MTLKSPLKAQIALFWLLILEEGYTGPMAQIHERQIYVMTFGLYFEVPAKKIEISKKKYIFGPD